MTDLPILVDREAEFDLLSAFFQALRLTSRSAIGDKAIDVLKNTRPGSLFACADTRSTFEEWQESYNLGRGREPEETIAARGLADDVSICGDCLMRFPALFRHLHNVGRERECAIREPVDWDRAVLS